MVIVLGLIVFPGQCSGQASGLHNNKLLGVRVQGTELLPFIVYFGAVILLVLTMLALSWLLGQRRANKATNMPFESGVVSVGTPQIHMSVEFYLIAIFFVIFDLETVFIFAWAVAFFELGWQGYAAIMLFIVVLTVALIYEWRSGALDWGIKTRVRLEEVDH
jgi:NADH-quinone oxidoreductase subunit A